MLHMLGGDDMARFGPKPTYTDEDLFEQARMLARELGRTPKKLEFDIDDRTASSKLCEDRFGSWKQFIILAGLSPRKPTGFTDEEIIGQLLSLARDLGRLPTSMEFKNSKKTTSLTTCYKHFGSWEGFLEAAGLRHD